MIVAYIDAYKRDFGVEPICRVLRDHDLPIAPSTCYAFKKCSRSARRELDPMGWTGERVSLSAFALMSTASV